MSRIAQPYFPASGGDVGISSQKRTNIGLRFNAPGAIRRPRIGTGVVLHHVVRSEGFRPVQLPGAPRRRVPERVGKPGPVRQTADVFGKKIVFTPVQGRPLMFISPVWYDGRAFTCTHFIRRKAS